MNDSFGTGGGGFNTTGAGETVDNKSEGILPVVVRQIQNCSEDGLQVFGENYKMMTFVGIVRDIQHSSTKITYTLEDYSGRMDAFLWLEEGDTMASPQVLLDSYARVVGSVRTSAGVKNVMIFKIEAIKTINEVTTHYLEVLMARYKGEEFSKMGGGSSKMQTNNTGTISTQMEDIIGLKGKELAVYQAIKACKLEIGMSRTELLEKFPQITAADLINITEHMSQEGHIYTSIDLDHFLCVS